METDRATGGTCASLWTNSHKKTLYLGAHSSKLGSFSPSQIHGRMEELNGGSLGCHGEQAQTGMAFTWLCIACLLSSYLCRLSPSSSLRHPTHTSSSL